MCLFQTEAQSVRSLAFLVILIFGCLLVPGCAIFNKKSTDTKTPATGTGNGTSPAKFPTSTDPLINGGHASQTKSGAVLAGRVIDNFSKPPTNTSIRLVSMDGKETGNPTEVNVMADGYFIIQGLKAGASYKLMARGKNGDHILAGITQTLAPNLTVVIQVKEEFANAGTPDVQGTPAFQDNDKKPAKTSGLDSSNNNFSTGTWPTKEFEMPTVNVPVPNRVAPPPPVPANQNWEPAPSVASDKGTFGLPPLEIPNPTIKSAPFPLLIPKTTPTPPVPAPDPFLPKTFPGEGRLDGPARVPSCVKVGNKLINLALNDVNGEPWEFKRNRQGKLVLIDFWGTWCDPCIKTIPSLIKLQADYGNKGLEIIGIANEQGGSPQELAYRLDSKARQLHINYRQLLSTSTDCPVRAQFRIDSYPTMVLVDQDGTILWRHSGRPDRATLDVLERYIQSKLYN